MLERADSAVVGSIIAKEVWQGPLDSPDFVVDFTTLTVEGDDLVRGGKVTHRVTFLGSETHPVSEMPAASEIAVGTQGVFFSKKLADAWGGRANQWSMVAAQGGVYRIEKGPKGEVVVGKGDGFAVSQNKLVAEFRTDVASTLAVVKRGK